VLGRPKWKSPWEVKGLDAGHRNPYQHSELGAQGRNRERFLEKGRVRVRVRVWLCVLLRLSVPAPSPCK